MTDKQLSLLRHMLGINIDDQRNPREYRDYYCANAGDSDMLALCNAGMVERYMARDARDTYEWWRTTDAGKAAARASQRAMLLPKSKRVYRRFLSVRDACADLTFREFLVEPEFAAIRRDA